MIFATLLIASTLHAQQTPTESTSTSKLRAQAIQELKTETKVQTSASEVSVQSASLLKLADPHLKQSPNPWTVGLGIQLQNYAPKNSVQLLNGQVFNTSEAGQTVIPRLEVQLTRSIYSTESILYSVLFAADAGYTSQKTQIKFTTGLPANDSRLSTGTAGASLMLAISPTQFEKFSFALGLRSLTINTSQFSSDAGANFSESNRSLGTRLGLSYKINKNLLANVDYNQIEFIPGLSLGAKLLW
jgi:hypothetical protein